MAGARAPAVFFLGLGLRLRTSQSLRGGPHISIHEFAHGSSGRPRRMHGKRDADADLRSSH
jgi:hypothetical protein